MANRTTAYLSALIVFLVDQASKWAVAGPLGLTREGDFITLLPIFNFTRVHNEGISLGMLQANSDLGRWLLVAMTGAIALAVAWWISREDKRGDQLALSLILGGALGNIVDRVRFGYVLDFLDLHFGAWKPFYVFNVADAAISIGVVILLLRALFVREKAPEGTNEHA
ncbi:signal peptidase II [Sphingomonas jaspsi]|uniref:signal peptidase II n=1 Tax=Sphingomonas jaspsi TaxID=392409 RepID=UPI0004B5F8F6|nr:signal peptidase II [Sphingomonas jaspsi]